MLLLVEAKKKLGKKSFSRVSDFIQKYFWQAQTDKIENKDFEIFATWNLKKNHFQLIWVLAKLKIEIAFHSFFSHRPQQ